MPNIYTVYSQILIPTTYPSVIGRQLRAASRAGTLPSNLPEGEYTLDFSVTDSSTEAVLTHADGMTYDATKYMLHHSLLVSMATHEEHAPKNQSEARRMAGKWTSAEFKELNNHDRNASWELFYARE